MTGCIESRAYAHLKVQWQEHVWAHHCSKHQRADSMYTNLHALLCYNKVSFLPIFAGCPIGTFPWLYQPVGFTCLLTPFD